MENIQSEVDTDMSPSTREHRFYVVSPKKFTILFLSTMGLYGMYWVYINWSLYKKSTGSDVWPVARGFFDIFFVHSLCKKIGQLDFATTKENSVMEWNAIKYVLLVISCRIADKLSENEIGMPYTFFYTLLAIPLMYRALYDIQIYVNKMMKDEAGTTNASLTWANYLWMILGVVFWGLAIFVSYAIILGKI
ncbi:hypothetical protein [Photobacterium galatheae]|nr:hypothetical protein [Photobacterium galatheae]MCM0149714.1 hypothetical protein [Photobacterium galatheae]